MAGFVTVGVPPVGVTLTDTLAVARRLCAYRGTQLAQVVPSVSLSFSVVARPATARRLAARSFSLAVRAPF